jgi:acid stress-induced BolA-like protein IbaG/YrbA
MDPKDIESLVKASIQDALVEVEDFTGTGDHFLVKVASEQFKGKMLIEQHKIVHDALAVAMNDGRIHAVQIKTETHDEWGKRKASGNDEIKILE